MKKLINYAQLILQIFMFSIFFMRPVCAVEIISVHPSVFYNDSLPFMAHRGEGYFDTALAMNVQYAPIKLIRNKLSKALGHDLKFFTLWDQEGEAHITVITPVEYSAFLKKYVSIERIEQIALERGIQHSEFSILGLGRGEAWLNGKLEETYFIIVQSQNLNAIRAQIYQEYLQNGGPANLWSPTNFYPHITIGYSLRDLHESDGVIKDVAHTFDPRFFLLSN